MEQDLIKLIESKKPGFSKGQKRIAAYITENYDKAAYMTAARLGALVDVSESTVVRFANVLGFEGYPELQQAMQAYIRTRLTSFQRVEITNKLIGDADVLDKVLLSDIDKIKHTLELVDRDSFKAAVEKIVSARKIYIIGMRSASSLAGFLTSASASTTFARMLTEAILSINSDFAKFESVISGVSVVVITIIMSYFSLVLGELAPKRMAMQKPEEIAYKIVDIGFTLLAHELISFSPQCIPNFFAK